MLYFKHADLVNKYHVSLKTVHNWIDAAKLGKLELELFERNGRTYIANKPGNITILEQLAEQGKKYRNVRYQKVATPKPEFYELFNRKQILDIITNLSVHREIPRQYNYFDGGAESWDRFAQRMSEEDDPNVLNATIELLDANIGAIDLLLEGHDRVNLIDIGPGNALPVKKLLEHLLKQNKLHRYVAIDISESMLKIAENNIRDWFGDRVKFEGYVKDITYERFDDLLVDDMLGMQAEQTINLALFLGGTPTNFREPFDAIKVICRSLGQNDFLVYTVKPDSEVSRRYFDFNPNPQSSPVKLSPNHRLIFDLLDIADSLYDVEMGYDEQKRVRFIQVRLKNSLTIKFQFENGERSVDINRGESVLLWRSWHRTALETISEFEMAGFTLLQASMTKNRQFLLTISGVDAKSEAAA